MYKYCSIQLQIFNFDSMLKITFLGTGTSQGIPVIGSSHPVCLSDNKKDKRLRVSLLVSLDNNNYIIDCGPDFRQQMLVNQINYINGILITHEHADHTSGLDDIRPFYFRQGKIPIYTHKRVINSLKKRFDYIFDSSNKYPGVPSVEINEITFGSSFLLNSNKIIPIKVMHDKISVMGFRIKNFGYLTDVKTIDNIEIKKLKKLEVLVINALRIEPHPSHLNLDEAIRIIDLLKPKVSYLTHVSHLLGFHDEVERKLPNNVYLAYDNLSINIKK